MRPQFLAVLLFASGLAFAFSPEELLTAREVKISCEKSICTVSESDIDWMVGRDRLLSVMVQKLYGQMQACRGDRVT